MADIKLPEITIEGSADAQPINASDWFAEGFMVGFNAPDSTPARPLMINDDLAGNFFQGVSFGRSTAVDLTAEFERSIADQPQVVPDIAGRPWKKRRNDSATSLRDSSTTTCRIPKSTARLPSLYRLPPLALSSENDSAREVGFF